MDLVFGGKYRHYKGNFYKVVGCARHSETLEEMVVYRQQYGDFGLWIRPKKMFLEEVSIDGQRVPRFAFVGGESEIVDTAPNHEYPATE
jgi:hypothetical protein